MVCFLGLSESHESRVVPITNRQVQHLYRPKGRVMTRSDRSLQRPSFRDIVPGVSRGSSDSTRRGCFLRCAFRDARSCRSEARSLPVVPLTRRTVRGATSPGRIVGRAKLNDTPRLRRRHRRQRLPLPRRRHRRLRQRRTRAEATTSKRRPEGWVRPPRLGETVPRPVSRPSHRSTIPPSGVRSREPLRRSRVPRGRADGDGSPDPEETAMPGSPA